MMSKININPKLNNNNNTPITWLGDIKLNNKYYSFLDVAGDPDCAIKMLKNIDKIVVNKADPHKYDLITSIIISWATALHYKDLPKYEEINELVGNIVSTPNLYEHLKDKAIFPISINLLSDPNNFNGSNILHNKIGDAYPLAIIQAILLDDIDPYFINDNDQKILEWSDKMKIDYGDVTIKDTLENYDFATLSKNIKEQKNPDLILHLLNNISKLQVTPLMIDGKIYSDFIDILIILNENFKYYQNDIYQECKDLLKNIAHDPIQQDYLRKIGATQTDIALLSGDQELIKELAHNNINNTPQLFNDWRCIDLALSIHANSQNVYLHNELFYFLTATQLTIPGSQSISVAFVATTKNLKYVNPDLDNHNTAILISSGGGFAWNGKNMHNDFEHIKKVFDHTYFYGDGIQQVNNKTISSVIQNIFAKEIYNNNHKTIYVELHLHGSENGSNIVDLVNLLPNKPSNVEVIYFIKACHSRHGIKDLTETDIIKKGNFIVSADYDESSRTSRDFNVEKLCKKIEKNSSSLEGYLDYFAKDFQGSKIFFSGKLQDGTVLKNVSIEKAHLIDNQITTASLNAKLEQLKMMISKEDNDDSDSQEHNNDSNIYLEKDSNVIKEDNNNTTNNLEEDIAINVNTVNLEANLFGITDNAISDHITG